MASSVMSPRPDWVNSSALESLLLLLAGQSPPARGVELCRASQLRDDERAHWENSPSVYCTNQWQQIFQGPGQKITIIVGNTSLCKQSFSPPGEDAGNALWFGTSIVHVILQRSYVA